MLIHWVLPPYTGEKKHLDVAGIEPGPPELLAATLSITPWPLGHQEQSYNRRQGCTMKIKFVPFTRSWFPLPSTSSSTAPSPPSSRSSSRGPSCTGTCQLSRL